MGPDSVDIAFIDMLNLSREIVFGVNQVQNFEGVLEYSFLIGSCLILQFGVGLYRIHLQEC